MDKPWLSGTGIGRTFPKRAVSAPGAHDDRGTGVWMPASFGGSSLRPGQAWEAPGRVELSCPATPKQLASRSAANLTPRPPLRSRERIFVRKPRHKPSARSSTQSDSCPALRSNGPARGLDQTLPRTSVAVLPRSRHHTEKSRPRHETLVANSPRPPLQKAAARRPTTPPPNHRRAPSTGHANNLQALRPLRNLETQWERPFATDDPTAAAAMESSHEKSMDGVKAEPPLAAAAPAQDGDSTASVGSKYPKKRRKVNHGTASPLRAGVCPARAASRSGR